MYSIILMPFWTFHTIVANGWSVAEHFTAALMPLVMSQRADLSDFEIQQAFNEKWIKHFFTLLSRSVTPSLTKHPVFAGCGESLQNLQENHMSLPVAGEPPCREGRAAACEGRERAWPPDSHRGDSQCCDIVLHMLLNPCCLSTSCSNDGARPHARLEGQKACMDNELMKMFLLRRRRDRGRRTKRPRRGQMTRPRRRRCCQTWAHTLEGSSPRWESRTSCFSF